MKKNKRQRLRLKPLESSQKPGPSAQPEGTGLRPLAWFGGLGLLVLIGYFVFQGAHKPDASTTSEIARTNSTDLALNGRTTASSGADAPDGATNRPGAAKNREAEGSADDMNNRGVKLLDGGDAAGSVPIFRRAVELKPDDETFHFNLAVAYMKSGDETNAEHEYKEALRLLPDYPEANNNYGNLLAHTGRSSEAEQHLNEAVTGMPQSAQFNNSLGVVRQSLKKTNEAMLSFQKAVECDTNFMEAHFNLAECYLARHDREKGIVELLEVLRIKPGFAPAKRILSRLTSAP